MPPPKTNEDGFPKFISEQLAPEASEDKLRRFSSRLLAAEEAGFRGDLFYSPDALRMILQDFCNIIAENLQAQSCTVQLKLYDLSGSPLLEDLFKGRPTKDKEITSASIRQLKKKFSQGYQQRWKEVVGDNNEFRERMLKDSVIFPYALYPKGALWLVAANKESPWAECRGWLVNELTYGITTKIVQDKAARVRDRMSIRKTRSHRKLGALDPYIWTNELFKQKVEDSANPQPTYIERYRYFFNYYGVPIRIHQGGDVIGILRVENKGLDASSPLVHQLLDDVLRLPLKEAGQPEELASKLHEVLTSGREEIRKQHKEFELSDISLLSLVYLAHDLASMNHGPNHTIGDLCTLPYPIDGGTPTETGETLNLRYPRDAGLRPPVQMTFDSLEEEDAFVNWLSGISGIKRTPEDEPRRLEAVMAFYARLNASLKERPDAASKIDDQIKNGLQTAISHVFNLRDSVKPKIRCKIQNIDAGRSLLRSVRLEVPDEHRFVFHVQVTPSQSEIERVQQDKVYWGLSEKFAGQYHTVNARAVPNRFEEWEFHLATDRLAARIGALTFAFPIPAFTINDAWWLSWAALEIGKLIERQISYRGTNLSPTVPLTAMDFFRVPISDLSFVDALRNQHKAAEAIQGMLQYYIPNHCRELNLDVKLEHHCRVKEFRSYLERLGQEHRAHYDSLIAIWLYVLNMRLGELTETKLSNKREAHLGHCVSEYLPDSLVDRFSNLDHCKALYDQTIALVKDVKEFCQAIEDVCEDKDILFTRDQIKWLRKVGNQVLGDLKFAAPNVELADKDRERARQLVLDNLRDSPQAASKETSPDISNKDINEYVFRRYDPFVTQSISLYILLTNAEKLNGNGRQYEGFYKKCRDVTQHLRKKFESSHQLHEQFRNAPNDLSAQRRKKLIDTLEKLRAKVFSLSTTDFCAVLETAGIRPGPESDNVYLTVRGIYKRIRTLVNIAGNQVLPPMLNWETSRFDYVGARINCLFKNQVFAIYEHLWNRGDPFAHWTSGEPKKGCPDPKAGPARQRWLSIRTNRHTGEDGYNAWQLSALLDPRAVEKGHWADSIYNVNALRNYLVLSFDKWHSDAAKEYRVLASERNGWQREYCEWFSNIRKILRGERPSREREQDIYFPEYLLRTPFDIFIRLLETDEVQRGDFRDILNHLRRFIGLCLKDDAPATLWPVAEKIYDKARKLAQKPYLNNEALKDALEGQLPVLDKEAERFRTSQGKWPDRKAFKNKLLKARLADMKQVLLANDKVTEIWRKGLQHILIDLQSLQKQYLFDIGETRGAPNILDRILCYILLFDPDLEGDDCKAMFKDWRAYDLFYYLMSLVPAEIQVRTALADAMAEQYHGVYKSSADPASSVAVQRERLQGIGRKLDDLDRETEAQYEGYILHSILHDED